MSTPNNAVSRTKSPKSTFNFLTNGERWWQLLIWFLLVSVGIVMLMPLIWLLSSSLKAQTQVFAFPPQWIPSPIQWSNYAEALTIKPFHLYLRNTLFIAVVNVIAVVFVASFCAYGFARIEFPGRDFWFGVVLATMMIPYFVVMVPQFVIYSRLGWTDTYLPLTVHFFFGGGAFNIFLFRQFFLTLPNELADAARIDGCSEFAIYWRIMLPLTIPALITVAIFTFLFAWNDFIGPLLYINSADKFTIALGLASFRGALRSQWHLLMAATMATTLPVIILFFFLQRYFIKGVVMSGLKG